MSGYRNTRKRAIGQLAKAARRRQIATMNRLRDLAVLDRDRMELRATLVEAELVIALGEAAGADLAKHRAEVDGLREVVAAIDRKVDALRLAAGLPAEGIAPRVICPIIDEHLNDIGLGRADA